MVGLRGLVPNTDDQVFRIYLAVDFAFGVRQGFRAVQEQLGRKAVANAKMRDARSHVETEVLRAFEPLNRDLRKFFEGSDNAAKYVVQKGKLTETVLGFAPQVAADSILTIQGNYSYRTALMVGIEWGLSAMYLMLFAGVEMETESPAIAAFVVFCLDVLLVRAFQKKTSAALAKKALLDPHFILD
jgi:hypothetical protein